MTRAEAIDRFKEARAGHKEFLSVETLNMAIKALEQEPFLQKAYNKGFEDCRQAVLELATTIVTDDYSCNEILDVVDVEEIKQLSPVNPQPKTM